MTDKEKIAALDKALRLVLRVVGDCHSCWILSADDDELAEVEVALSLKEMQ